MASQSKITIRKPDDLHLHLRSHPFTQSIVGHTATQFARAAVMPNLNPPVTSVEAAMNYRKAILDVLPQGMSFDPRMLLYLTDNTSIETIKAAAAEEKILGFKLYPQGATTGSDFGVTSIEKAYPLFEAMEKNGVVLAIHGEVVDSDVDIFDREKQFIDQFLKDICKTFPNLRVVLEHITTKDAAQFVNSMPDNVAATITAHHLIINRNHMLVGGIQPHHYCLPVAKRETHRLALVEAATSGKSCYFLGTDSAPHSIDRKETACGCAGIYTAHAAMELYAEVFAAHNKLELLEDFSSRYGAEFYGLPLNEGTITLEQTNWEVPASYPFADAQLVPFRASKEMSWKQVL